MSGAKPHKVMRLATATDESKTPRHLSLIFPSTIHVSLLNWFSVSLGRRRCRSIIWDSLCAKRPGRCWVGRCVCVRVLALSWVHTEHTQSYPTDYLPPSFCLLNHGVAAWWGVMREWQNQEKCRMKKIRFKKNSCDNPLMRTYSRLKLKHTAIVFAEQCYKVKVRQKGLKTRKKNVQEQLITTTRHWIKTKFNFQSRFTRFSLPEIASLVCMFHRIIRINIFPLFHVPETDHS